MPNFETNAPQGYMGDWTRGAPLGRPYIGPDPRTLEELLEDFAAACKWLSDALTLKENRPADSYKAHAWEYAAAAARKEKETLRELVKAAKERETATPKVTLRRVRLDSGGYDPAGAYWGHGENLYWAATDDGALDMMIRGADREAAKDQVRRIYPRARFYR